MDYDRTHPPRDGWSEAVDLLLERGDDYVLDEYSPARFDEEEWEW